MSVLHSTERFSPVAAIVSLVAERYHEVSARIQAWNKANEVRAELMRYTDRELADIGLSRDQVRTMDLTRNA